MVVLGGAAVSYERGTPVTPTTNTSKLEASQTGQSAHRHRCRNLTLQVHLIHLTPPPEKEGVT